MTKNWLVGLAAVSSIVVACNQEVNTDTQTRAVVVNGLRGDYFPNMTLTAPATQTRIDAPIDLWWSNGSPFPGTNFPSDHFSARWTGKVVPLYSQTYTFYVTAYDGARLYINNQLVIDAWTPEGQGERSGNIALTANTPYDIVLEYYEDSGAADVHLSWSSASQAKKIVPSSQLIAPSSGPTPLLTADFENENATCWATRNSSGATTSQCGIWNNVHNARATLAANEKAHSGTHAFKASYVKNEDETLAIANVDVNHVFVQFYEYYDTNFDFAAGMKTFRLQSFNTGTQLNNYDIIAVVKALHGPQGINDYCGTNPTSIIYLQKNAGATWAQQNISLSTGRWYRVEIEVKLNTPGASDGEARLWYDGVKVLEATGLDIRGSQTANINRVGIGGWYSNGASGQNACPDPVNTSNRYIDDVIVASQYIGP